MIIASPTPHSPRITSAHFDEVGRVEPRRRVADMPSAEQDAGSPVPYYGLKRNTNASAAATGGAIAGRKYIVR